MTGNWPILAAVPPSSDVRPQSELAWHRPALNRCVPDIHYVIVMAAERVVRLLASSLVLNTGNILVAFGSLSIFTCPDPHLLYVRTGTEYISLLVVLSTAFRRRMPDLYQA